MTSTNSIPDPYSKCPGCGAGDETTEDVNVIYMRTKTNQLTRPTVRMPTLKLLALQEECRVPIHERPTRKISAVVILPPRPDHEVLSPVMPPSVVDLPKGTSEEARSATIAPRRSK